MFKRSRKLDRIISKCIQAIEEKGWTIDDCLRHYASYSSELEPMLQTALRLRRARRVKPSSTFKSNAQLRIRKRLQASRRSPWLSKSTQLSRPRGRERVPPPRMQLAGSLIPLVLISVLLIGAGATIAFAADSAKPGDALFQVDRAIEQTRIRFENDAQQLVRLRLQFADERIKELIELIEQENFLNLMSALAEYKEQIGATAPLIVEAQIAGEDIEPLITETSDTLMDHEDLFNDLIDDAPDEFEESIRNIIDELEDFQKFVTSDPDEDPDEVPDENPIVNPTPEPMVYEPSTPTKRSPSNIPPPTTPPDNAPPGPTETPGYFLLPSATPPDAPGVTETATSYPYATPTPVTTTPTATPTGTRSPTPTPTHTPSPTNTPNKTPPTNTPEAEK